MKYLLNNSSKYEILILLIAIIALLGIVVLWIWIGYRNYELERQIRLLN